MPKITKARTLQILGGYRSTVDDPESDDALALDFAIRCVQFSQDRSKLAKKGGQARAASLSGVERSKIAKLGGQTRWKNKKDKIVP